MPAGAGLTIVHQMMTQMGMRSSQMDLTLYDLNFSFNLLINNHTIDFQGHLVLSNETFLLKP